MKTIRLTDNLRLRKSDERNWMMQEFREPTRSGGSRKTEDFSEKWFDTGNYFQDLGSALAWAYERALRMGDDDLGLKEAMEQARQLHDGLLSVKG